MSRRRAIGYEIKCSEQIAKVLGAWFGVYQGRNILHWDQGYLWWIE